MGVIDDVVVVVGCCCCRCCRCGWQLCVRKACAFLVSGAQRLQFSRFLGPAALACFRHAPSPLEPEPRPDQASRASSRSVTRAQSSSSSWPGPSTRRGARRTRRPRRAAPPHSRLISPARIALCANYQIQEGKLKKLHNKHPYLVNNLP